MIAGIQLSSIKPNDLYRRFLILEKILSHKETFLQLASTSEQPKEYLLKKYLNLRKQLQSLQNYIRGENYQYLNRQLQGSLILTELQRDFQRYTLVAEKCASQYESKMMQTWRDGIRKNEEKEKLGRNESESKSSNNKNLMFLTSELLKNDRNSKMSIKKEELKLLGEIEKMREMVKTKRQEFDKEMQKIDQLFAYQMSHQINHYQQSTNQDYQNQIANLQLTLGKIRDEMNKEQEQGQKFFSELCTILDDLKLKYL